MKKSVTAALTAALLLAAVLCTAGCVATEDKIVGLWYTDDENGFTYAQFSPDKSAVFAVQKQDRTTETASAVWKADGGSIYTITMNGKDISCTLNAKRGVLDMNGVLYQKTASPLSGATGAGGRVVADYKIITCADLPGVIFVNNSANGGGDIYF